MQEVYTRPSPKQANDTHISHPWQCTI